MRPRHLPAFQDDVFRTLRRARKIALFLDFDGTLARLHPLPTDVYLGARTRRCLYSLAHSPRIMVWIVSGRRRADVRRRVGVPGIRYLGLYGWESSPGLHLAPENQRALNEVRLLLQEMLLAGEACRNLRGVWLEDKQFSFTLHHTGTNSAAVERMLKSALSAHGARLRLVPARRVFEVIPVELRDKGRAVEGELTAAGAAAMPIYMGDDYTDEPAFAALRHGITVLVGKTRPTRAAYRLQGVADVHTFLEQLEGEFA